MVLPGSALCSLSVFSLRSRPVLFSGSRCRSRERERESCLMLQHDVLLVILVIFHSLVKGCVQSSGTG
jgi:hypothetical protein